MKRQRLRLEALEAREVPAVTVKPGLDLIGTGGTADVLITGTAAAESIQISTPGGTNRIQIDAGSGTTLTLDTSALPSSWQVVTNTPSQIVVDAFHGGGILFYNNIRVVMGGGDDIVDFDAAPLNNLEFYLGAGNDTLRLKDSVVCSNGGSLVIRDPAPRVRDGNDTITISNVFVGGDASGSAEIRFFNGNDRLRVENTDVTGDLSIGGGAGNDVVQFVPGAFFWGPGRNIVGGKLSIAMHGGNDRVFVDAAAGASDPATLAVDGQTRIFTHGGDDFINFGSGDGSGSSVGLQATLIDTGAGNDRLAVQRAIMAYLIALLGDGNDAVLNDWGSASVSVGGLSLLDGGAGTDSLPTGWTAPTNLVVVHFP